MDWMEILSWKGFTAIFTTIRANVQSVDSGLSVPLSAVTAVIDTIRQSTESSRVVPVIKSHNALDFGFREQYEIRDLFDWH